MARTKTIDQCLTEFHGCMTTSTLAPAPASRMSVPAARAPAPAQGGDAKSRILQTGQAIQVAPVVISTSNPPTPTGNPTRSSGPAKSYTISMDINTSGKAVNWFRVYGADPHPGFPAIWIQPASEPGFLRIHYGNASIDTPASITGPFNTYFNVTAVYDSVARTGTIYFNGTQVATKAIPAFTLASPPTAMVFNSGKTTTINTSVKNVYWFNKVLTAAEVATISKASATRSMAAADPCAGMTDTSLASSVSPACLQKIWKDNGCSENGTVYPSSNYKGWWTQSPNGLETVWCDATHSGTQCGAGNFAMIKKDINYWATSTAPDRVAGCKGPKASAATGMTKQSILATGTSLFTGPTNLKDNWNPAGIPVSTRMIPGSGPVTYTLSFYVKPGPNVAKNGTWPNVFLRGDSATNQNNRCPGIWFNTNTLTLAVRHSGNTNMHSNGPPSTSSLAPGAWSHIIVVVDKNVMLVYINGVLDKTYNATDPFVWGSSANAWVNMGTSKNPGAPGDWAKPNDSLEVKDYYWFNKALTTAEVASLASAGGSGTSGYALEGSPFGGVVGGRNWKLILTLFLLVILLWIVAQKM